MDVLHILGWYPESAHSLTRLYMASSSMVHAHLQALPINPDIPGVFSWAAVNMASFTSLFVTLTYSMSSEWV